MTPLRRQLQSMLHAEPRENGFTATFKLSPDLSILPDHFRGAPILPGVCMVQLVLLSAAHALHLPDLHLRHLKTAKIMRPVLPNDQVRIEGTITQNPDESLTIKGNFTTEAAQRCAEFSLTATAHLPPLPPGEDRGERERETPGDGELRATLPVTRVFNPCNPESGAI